MHGRGLIISAAILAALAGPALGQERPPAARQALVDLSYVLGESHALRQACAGADDQYWRQRMQRVLDVEAPDDAFKARLARSFNTGYAAGQTGFPGCTPATRAEAAASALRGKTLADRLGAP